MGDFQNAMTMGAQAIAQGIKAAATHNAKAAAAANGVSRQAQINQGNFNAGQATIANTIGSDRLAEQYSFNSAQAAMANDFTERMWDKSAAFNEMMWNKAAEFNAAEAQKNRDWQEQMRATSYQTAIKDMEAAGLNPILAVTGGGVQTGTGGGGAASIGMQSMSGANGAMAAGGVMNGISASEGNYTGQMEYMSGVLGLLAAGMDGLSTALSVMGHDDTDLIRTIIEGLIPGTAYYKGMKKDKEQYEASARNNNNPTYKGSRNDFKWRD